MLAAGRPVEACTVPVLLKNSSIGTSTNVGPRCDEPASVNASSSVGAMSSTLRAVVADLEIDAKIGGWSSSCRLPVPQRLFGARPPTTTSGEPAKLACATGLTPLVTPGPAVSTARPGVRVSLPMASAANTAVGSWRTSMIGIAGSALTAASYIGNTCAPDSVNIASTPWARATSRAWMPPCTGAGVAGEPCSVCSVVM